MTFERNSPARCYMTPPPSSWKSSRPLRSPTVPFSERKKSPASVHKDDLFHVIHKVPSGDSPYVKAKQVQLVEKDPGRAISLFWAAINAGDRVESALKDMALVMKQLNRSDEAIEAIKSFRHLCPSDSQESLDNILVELYKRSGRVDEEIGMLHHKLKQIEDGMTFVGRSTKQARSQGKKIQITAEQEISRILGNLAWAYLQKGDYKTAEEHYRKALSFEVDRNKQCNLAVCLMQMNKITEARFLLQAVTAATKNRKMDDSFVKSFERATEMLREMESTSLVDPVKDKGDKFIESQRFSGRNNMSSSQYSTPNTENSSGKNSDNMVKTRTENNWSLTSDSEEPRHSHARRRLYESPDPYAKPKRSSWGFNNHSDSKPSPVTYPNEKVPCIIKPNSTQNQFFPDTNASWRTRTFEDNTAVVKYGPTTTVKQGNTITVYGSGTIHPKNTETAVKFTKNDDNNKSDTNVNGAKEFAASVDRTDQQDQDEKPIQKKSWADMVEEEQQTEEYEFFKNGYTNFGAEMFSNENEDSNIELLNLKNGYNAAPVKDPLSRNPTVRRSLFTNPGERDLFTGEEKLTRRVRLQVFQDITSSS
ncbi:protein POLLENLESS 3-like [Vicia villosa]|uniref:protein POLLENLESS 3-like n=1 Tax=Vicia villosa TaxID=3911 RepID=UPI00273BF832|nr:protein POLLENLESS 3-like [Vicia villosa]